VADKYELFGKLKTMGKRHFDMVDLTTLAFDELPFELAFVHERRRIRFVFKQRTQSINHQTPMIDCFTSQGD
jgi:hypothetical protein